MKNFYKISINDLKNYSKFLAFEKDNQEIEISKFQKEIFNEVELFNSNIGIDFDLVSELCSEIISTLPFIKKVFSKPWLILNDANEVLPSQFSKKIEPSSFTYLSQHSNDVEQIKESKIIPSRLLSKVYVDYYSIYENQIFCLLIDEILSFTRFNQRNMNEILLSKEKKDIDFYSKTNHSNYFFALAKLHISYAKNFANHGEEIEILNNYFEKIINTITPRLKKPVYRYSNTNNFKASLRRTNLFIHEKNYHQIYKLYKSFLKYYKVSSLKLSEMQEKEFKKAYLYFVSLLTIFSILEFNFSTKSKTFSLNNIDLFFEYEGFNLTLKSFKESLLLEFKKDQSYKILLVPFVEDNNEKKKFLQFKGFDEILFLSPILEDYFKSDEIYVSLQNLDSFRRIEQIILKGMIYCDKQKSICPFCGNKLIKKNNSYLCSNCGEEISKKVCSETNEEYYISEIHGFKKPILNSNFLENTNKILYSRKVEAAKNFRNINKIDEKFQNVCPHCNKAHLL